MHGLIAADSLGIPNVWVENTYKTMLVENRFKYHDYYSLFGIKKEPLLSNEILKLTVNDIIDSYKVKKSEVEIIKRNLYGTCLNIFS